MKTPIHMEIPADDTARARKFYENAFGWKFSQMGDYFAIDICGDPKARPDVTGGMLRREPGSRRGITNYMVVKSVKEYAGNIKKLGGTITHPPTEIPGIGWFCFCTDTEGNTFALWQNADSKNMGKEAKE